MSITKTTLSHIAEAAGVSLSTVDRVLNRRGGVSPKKEAKVLECAQQLNLDRRLFKGYLKLLRVAVVMQSPKNPFFKRLRDEFTDYTATHTDLRLSCFVQYVNIVNPSQTEAELARIAQSYDAMVIVGPNTAPLRRQLKAIASHIPVITLVSDIPQSGRLAYVGPDNRKAGRVAGELIGRFLGPAGGDVLILLGLHQYHGHEEREMGFRALLRERFSQCRIVDMVESNEDQALAGKLVRDAFWKNPNIRAIYNISAGNSAIVKALKSLGVLEQTVVVTHELTPDRRALLQEGHIDAIIDQSPRQEVERAIESLAQYFNRLDQPLVDQTYTPFQIFLRENCPDD